LENLIIVFAEKNDTVLIPVALRDGTRHWPGLPKTG
jgi:hypothetical protein